MDKFVIGSVVTAIDYPSIQFSIRLAVATAFPTRLISFSMAALFLQHSMTLGCTAPREGAIGLSYRFAENNASVSHVATDLSSEEAFVAPLTPDGAISLSA
jgi:hypothetical protein